MTSWFRSGLQWSVSQRRAIRSLRFESMSRKENMRQRTKVFAKKAVFFAYLYSGYPWVRDFILSRLGLASVVVLCYHRIGSRGSMSKTPAEFRRDLGYLRKHYRSEE